MRIRQKSCVEQMEEARRIDDLISSLPKCDNEPAKPSSAEAPGSVDLVAIQLAIESNLEKIERVLGPNYKLTLLAKYHGAIHLDDADLLMTQDTRENILSVIDRHCPANAGTQRPGATDAPIATESAPPGSLE